MLVALSPIRFGSTLPCLSKETLDHAMELTSPAMLAATTATERFALTEAALGPLAPRENPGVPGPFIRAHHTGKTLPILQYIREWKKTPQYVKQLKEEFRQRKKFQDENPNAAAKNYPLLVEAIVSPQFLEKNQVLWHCAMIDFIHRISKENSSETFLEKSYRLLDAALNQTDQRMAPEQLTLFFKSYVSTHKIPIVCQIMEQIKQYYPNPEVVERAFEASILRVKLNTAIYSWVQERTSHCVVTIRPGNWFHPTLYRSFQQIPPTILNAITHELEPISKELRGSNILQLDLLKIDKETNIPPNFFLPLAINAMKLGFHINSYNDSLSQAADYYPFNVPFRELPSTLQDAINTPEYETALESAKKQYMEQLNSTQTSQTS